MGAVLVNFLSEALKRASKIHVGKAHIKSCDAVLLDGTEDGGRRKY